jgi:hypothetical protein
MILELLGAEDGHTEDAPAATWLSPQVPSLVHPGGNRFLVKDKKAIPAGANHLCQLALLSRSS